MTVPFPNGALESFVEIAFGADLDGDQADWVWTDVSDVQMAQTITTIRGRHDESSDVAPTTADMVLDNASGDFTPYNANSPYYPNVDLGTPGRWGITTDMPRLLVRPAEPSRGQITNTPAINITTDLDVRVDMHFKTQFPTSDIVVVADRSNATAYSWQLQVNSNRTVSFLWSSTGAPTPFVSTSTVPVLPMSARAILRVTMDVDNGAGGNDVKFYLGESMAGPWMQIGPTVTKAFTTTIFNAAADFSLGLPAHLGEQFTLDADVYAFQLRNGIDGTPVIDADFTIQTPGVTTVVDSAGRTWTLFGDTSISERWYRAVGTIDVWKPGWPWGDLSAQQESGLGVGQARTEISINGILRRLGQGALPLNSPLRRSIEDDTRVRAYWPMEDEDGATQIASALSDGSPQIFGGEIDLAADSGLIGSKPLPKFSATTLMSGAVSGVFTGEWQYDWYLYLPLASMGSGTWSILRATTTGTVLSWEIRVNSTTIEAIGFNSGGGTVTSITTSPTDFFDRFVHVRFYARQNGANVNATLKWTPVTFPPSADFSVSGSFAGSVGIPTAWGITPGAGLNNAVFGHMAVLAVSNVDNSANAAVGWMGENAMRRISRLCEEERVDLRTIGAGGETALMGPQRLETLVNLLSDAADADGGILYEQSYALGLVYRARSSLYNQPANLVLNGLLHQIANPFEPTRDDQNIRNTITVTRDGGSSTTVISAPSVAKHGTYDEAVTLNLLTDDQTVDVAGWLLHQGTIDALAYPQTSIVLGDTPELIDPWLTVDVAARVDITGLPPQHPSDSVRLMIEGYSEPISPVTWNPTANCSPASTWDVDELDGAWVDDQYLLRLETDGSILAAGASAVATTLFVTVTDGPPWVTAVAEFPFDAWVAGERVTVTAIGAPGGGQEFVGAGSNDDITATSSFVAPGVNAVAAGDLLICSWCSSAVPGTYTLPGGMTIGALTSGVSSSLEDATEVLGGAGPTGNRTAVFSGLDRWSAVTVSVHGAVTPTVANYFSGSSSPGPVTFTLAAQVGDWLLAFQGWEWDPGANMSPPSGDGWILVAASSPDGVITSSRIMVWRKRIMTSGMYTVTFGVTPDGVADNHARLYLLRGVTGVTQQFTVVRSVNGVVKALPAGSDVHLWFQPVLAR